MTDRKVSITFEMARNPADPNPFRVKQAKNITTVMVSNGKGSEERKMLPGECFSQDEIDSIMTSYDYREVDFIFAGKVK